MAMIAIAGLLVPGTIQAASVCPCHHRAHAILHHTKSGLQPHHHFRRHGCWTHRIRRSSDAAALRYAESYYNYRSPSTLANYDVPSAGLVLDGTGGFNGGVGYGTDGFSGTVGYGMWFEGADVGRFRRDFRKADFDHRRGRMHHGIRHGRWRR